MRLRRAAVLVVLGALAGAAVGRRRRSVAGRADVWFDDGSMVSLPATSPAGVALVELADEALRASG